VSVSTTTADATKRMGGHVSSRHYVAKIRCGRCGKRYAKPSAYAYHYAKHMEADEAARDARVAMRKAAP
jgi:hypothetical protein